MTKTPIWQWSAVETAAAIRKGEVTSKEVIHAHIDHMHKVNPALNAVVVDLGDGALRAAEAADVALAKSKSQGNDVGPLHGVPVTIKINIDVEGQANSNGDPALKDTVNVPARS